MLLSLHYTMATDPNVVYHLRDGCNGVKVRTLDITDYQLMNWSAIYHCVASVKRTMATSGLKQFRQSQTTKSLSKQSSFSNQIPTFQIKTLWN